MRMRIPKDDLIDLIAQQLTVFEVLTGNADDTPEDHIGDVASNYGYRTDHVDTGVIEKRDSYEQDYQMSFKKVTGKFRMTCMISWGPFEIGDRYSLIVETQRFDGAKVFLRFPDRSTRYQLDDAETFRMYFTDIAYD